MRAARAGHPAPPDPDQGGVRERHRRRHGARRLHQRRAAPAGHRRTRPGSSSRSTTSTGWPPGCRTSPTPSPHGKLPHDRRRPHRRRARGHEGSCSTPGCCTATASPSPGKTVAENLRRSTRPAPDGDVIHPLDRPDPRHRRHRRAHRLAGAQGRGGQGGRHRLRPLRGHRPRVRRRGRRRWRRSSPGRIEPGDVVVIRYEGPKGGPGMREMLAVTGAMKGAGRGGDCRARHRRPLLRRHPRVLHRPRGARGGRRRPHRLRARRRPHRHRRARPQPIDLLVDDAELARRQADWKLPEPRYTTGVLAKYARLAQGAERGAITEA